MTGDSNVLGTMEALVAEAADNYQRRLRRGERPTLEEYVRRYPRVADMLREVLPALQVMGAFGGEGTAPAALGDFRIGRELGRGGMGVVYEAEQLSLGRRVALKVLPFAAVMDPRQLERFRNEAQAAARLHHTHIVPVHSVGCERGVHYYAMQYIEGMTVAQMIEELRATAGRDMPGSSSAAVEALTKGESTRSSAYCRSVARLGVDVANALDHAHDQGVIHRDVKPANLILDTDGRIWVTDFGLAAFTNHPGLTVTGDVVGTVRYMSPEQALADRGPVDHRTDVYSLGVTLYEFLTLEAAVKGDDAHQVIHEIATRAPATPRALNPAVTRELETILLKAMAKDPADRYVTARELADDLSRYLEQRPIAARRPSAVKRAVMWVGRHRAIAWTAAAALVVSVVALASGVFFSVRAYRAEAAQRRETERTLALTLAALDEVYLKDVETVLPPDPQLGLQLYQQVARREGSAPEARLQAARAQRRIGRLHAVLGSYEIAEKALREAIERFNALGGELGDAVTAELAACHDDLGSALRELGRPREAEASYGEALALQRREATAHPEDLGHARAVAGIRAHLAALCSATGRPVEAENLLRAAIAEHERLAGSAPGPRHHADLAHALEQLGTLLVGSGQREEGLGTLQRAAGIASELAVGHEDLPGLQTLAAAAQVNLGLELQARGRWDEAEASLRTGLRRLKQAVAARPFDVDSRTELARVTLGLATLLREAGRTEPAQEELARGFALAEGLLSEFPEAGRQRRVLATFCSELAELYLDVGRGAESGALLERALQLLGDDASARARAQRALAHQRAGMVLYAADRHLEAESRIRTALEMRQALVRDVPAVPDHRRALAGSYAALGAVLDQAGRPDEALRADLEAHDVLAALVERHPRVANYRRDLARILRNLGVAHRKRGSWSEAEPFYRASLESWERLIDEGAAAPKDRFMAANLHAAFGNLLRGAGRPRETAKEWSRALELRRGLAAEFPGNESYEQMVVQTLQVLADLYVSLGERDAWIGAFRDILELRPDNAPACSNLAWVYAHAPDPALRDPEQAVVLAERATRKAPANGIFWSVLGAARYRVGDFAGALEALEESLRLSGGGEACDWLFLAMANAMLERDEEACRWYGKAAQSMEENKIEDPELRGFLAEAAELLGE